MKNIIAIFILISFTGFPAFAADKDIIGYADMLVWRMTIEEARKACGPFFGPGKETDTYICDRITEFQGVNFTRSMGIAKKLGLFRPKIKNTVLKFESMQLYEIDIVFEGKQDANMLKAKSNLDDAYKDFFSIVSAEFDAPKKSAKKGEMSLFRRLDIWSAPSGCMMLRIIGDRYEGELVLKYKGKCGTM